MKTYLRILSFARPYSEYIPQYLLFTTLSILFGLINFTMLIPLLRVLFDQVDPAVQAEMLTKPDFALNVDYLISLFDYYFAKIIHNFGKVGALVFVCSITLTSVFLTNLFRYISGLTLAKIRAKVISKLRIRIFDQVSRLHLGYFSNERKGDVMSRITNDVQEVENSVVSTLKVIFRDPATIIGFFAVLFFMSFKLTLFTLIIMPISGTIISEITKRLKRKATQSQESLGRIVNILDETLSGMRIVKAFNAREWIGEKFGKEVSHYARVNVSMARKQELASPLSEFMGIFVVTGILLYGGILVLNDNSELEASEFIAYIILFSQILPPAKSISNAVSSIQRGLASGERIFSTIDTMPQIEDKPDAVAIEGFHRHITFEQVSFAYENEHVLKNINLSIDKGKTVAIVGPSGGGKSTIADLIPRFYDPVAGKIYIDGIALTDAKIDSVRKLMGIVTQESILFNDSIYNNIAFGKPNAQEEEVIQAAKIANAHEFIMNTPQQYQTVIGERGTKLSGGQRQRLSIARAVLKNPPILILDEATSALDSESEKLVQEALTNLMKNRTSIVIAHRLSTIQHADEIIVVQNGHIIERGRHDQLVEMGGLYYKLTEMQTVS
ncbi:ABC transporter ATP-binding protein [Catalinimonas niigatensis]|uniref:ABC transporter ATP-binding protein n=1 Tax=Catalinimonas niigatensis TaxID=1397264 RepID=UPI00266619B2|nr:ABC transporter ATP-binding protein [Catalinimonas niigatensis]WPP52743.1 ABC transporter ATP-binding protein [Catalinimonas niigatensis]